MRNTVIDTKKFYPFKDGPPIYFRPGTSDVHILNATFANKPEYMLPQHDDIKKVFDCGGHIGIIAVVLARLYPQAEIYSFEPDYENFQILQRNIEPYKNVQAFNVALGENDGTGHLWPSDDPKNFGGQSLHIKTANPQLVQVRAISEVCRTLGTPDLIKIDTEGAEYEILHGMINLDKVKWICGELHGVLDFCTLDMIERAGFEIRTSRDFYSKVFHFHALNKSWTGLNPDPTPQEKTRLENVAPTH